MISQPDTVVSALRTDHRIRVALVAEAVSNLEILSKIVGRSNRFRLTGSHDSKSALNEIDQETTDLIVGHATSEQAFKDFQQVARQYAEIPSLLIVSGVPELKRKKLDEAISATAELAVLTEPAEVLETLRAVTSQCTITGVARDIARAEDEEKLTLLTGRERDVLALTAEGLSLKGIARQLNRSYGTVASHRSSVMQKVGIHDKVGLARFAIRVGLATA